MKVFKKRSAFAIVLMLMLTAAGCAFAANGELKTDAAGYYIIEDAADIQ